MGDNSNRPVAGGNPANHPIMLELKLQVERWLSDHNQKQGTLAADCGFDPADLAHFLKGERPLPQYALANLAEKLDIDPARLLLFGEYCQCVRRLRESSSPEDASATPSGVAKKRYGWEQAQQTFEALLQRLPSGELAHSPVIAPRMLGDWPMSFLPLMVFVGDRRETPPKSPADLLATSASMGDLHYLPQLRLPPETEIRSDKTVIIASRESIRNLVQDKNLLIIGSPAANLMARVVNSGACFSFHAKPEALRQALDFQKLLEPIRYLPDRLERYTDINSVTATEREWSRRRRYMIYGFARSGILDPVDYEGLRATTTPPYTDYGVISLCKHPWSDNRVAIIAAGLHGPATAASIKLLSQPNAFAERPLGGVFHVHVPVDAPWEERYHHLNPEFDTHEYTIASYAAAMQRFVEAHRSELMGEFGFWDPDAVGGLLELLSSSAEPRRQ
jgi:hypothetical protein